MKLPEKLTAEDAVRDPELVGLTINALISYLEEREGESYEDYTRLQDEVVTAATPPVVEEPNGINGVWRIPKPEWWDTLTFQRERDAFQQGLEAAGKASGVTFKLEE